MVDGWEDIGRKERERALELRGDAAEKQRIGDAFRRGGSLVTPTLIAWQPFLAPYATIQAVIDDTRGASDPRERTVSAALRRNCRSSAGISCG